MKKLFAFLIFLSLAFLLPAQTVTITEASCGIDSLVLALVGDDDNGRNVYEADFVALRIRLAYNYGTSRWEIVVIDQGEIIVFAYTTFDSSPNPPDLATASANSAPYTNGPDLDCGLTSVSGDGTQTTLGGDPCTDFSGDTDADGVCDDFDSCPGSDDLTDQDQDGLPDGCDPNPTTPDGVLLTASCLHDEPIVLLPNGTDTTGRNRYSNFVFQLHVEYNLADERWEVVAHDPGTQVFFFNEFPSFPNPPDNNTSAWTGTEATCTGSESSVAGTGTQDSLGCGLVIADILITDATCPDSTDAAIEILTQGAAGILAYFLNDTISGDTGSFPGLGIGNYEILVSDAAFPAAGVYTCAALDTVSIMAQAEDCEMVPSRNFWPAGGRLRELPVFPNPAKDRIRIDLSGLEIGSEAVSLLIYNALGQKLYQKSMLGDPGLMPYLDTSGLPGGVYFIQVAINRKPYAAARLVVANQ